MRLATIDDRTADGRLVVVSPNFKNFADAPVATLQHALEDWDKFVSQVSSIATYPKALNIAQCRAPLPRAWQWLDGSVYPSHGALMDKALGIEKKPVNRPLMYQGVSDAFLGPSENVPMASEALGIDFEGEFGVLTDRVPMGTSARGATRHIKLVVQINDWSLRALAGEEMQTGFGWIQAKPHCSMAPFAVAPDALGRAWKNSRPLMYLKVDWNGKQFGNACGGAMEYGFDELIAHAARTRTLAAGTVIGSGTVSNENYREVGSSCIAEKRGIEIVDCGEASTSFMKYGDRVRMEAKTKDGLSPFGAIDQKVVSA